MGHYIDNEFNIIYKYLRAVDSISEFIEINTVNVFKGYRIKLWIYR